MVFLVLYDVKTTSTDKPVLGFASNVIIYWKKTRLVQTEWTFYTEHLLNM